MLYLRLIRRPYVIRLLTGSLIGRMPSAMAALAIALTVREAGSGYRFVGVVTGIFAVAGAIGGPLLGRLVDRTGQPRVLVVSAVVSGLGYAVLALTPESASAVVAGAVLAGAAAPPLEPCMRALWPALVEEDQLESAYAVDAGAQEIMFIIGPLAVAGVAAFGPAPLALGLAAVLGLIGALIMATAAPSRDWRAEARDAHWLGPLRSPALLLLLFALFGAGWAVGTFNVFSVAYAEQFAVPGGAGTLMALSALGALLGAVTYGALGWSAAAPLKALLLCGGMAGAYWLVALVPGPLVACLVAVGTGVFFAPLLTVSFGMVGDLAPEGTVTEAFAWLVTLISAGIAVGSAVSGLLLADFALAAAAALGACGVTAGAVVLALSRARLARPVQAEVVVGVG
ncbi:MULTISPECIES: MFS transporter [Streptomyces]|uniref:MFS transporter n=1 Tax=Streptomyces caniscabiei TaxID=2746961 RepID=A0ABU4MIP3_9ACTN|nr:MULTISPECIES: MFS transporter [Streptomyces]MBE4736530.1 MFS transporter [Streptomyces caniscabiei]MBE4760760.1 MFS transporter [Streptomyces caniscabiei]MBE4770454.1 MFS transporter [Streptomyces caniscabiei]MBE4786443.1 MFS transporter [Streptomyces caniscabiei]MBE4796572.1 MFS transporter [Streptomyces caniscabiei]